MTHRFPKMLKLAEMQKNATSQPQCSTGGSNLTIADDLTVIMRTTIMEFGTSRDKY